MSNLKNPLLALLSFTFFWNCGYLHFYVLASDSYPAQTAPLVQIVPLSSTKTWDTQVERNAEYHHMGLQWSVTEKVHWKQFAKKSLGNHLDGYPKLKKEEMPL